MAPAADIETLTAASTVLKPLARAANDIATKVERAQRTLDRSVRDIDPAPRRFVGYVREYRYAAGRSGEMPTHRFKVDCGRGLYLFAQVPSDLFEERMMRDMDDDAEVTPSMVNGRLVVVYPDNDLNAVLPEMMVDGTSPPTDRFGNLLYVGCPIRVAAMTGTLLGCDGALFRVALEGTDDTDETYVEPKTVVRGF